MWAITSSSATSAIGETSATTIISRPGGEAEPGARAAPAAPCAARVAARFA